MTEHTMNSSPDLQPLEARITLALETAPEAIIPAGFAARIAAQLPARHLPASQAVAPVTLTPQRNGRNTAIACLAVLFALMLAIANRATSGSLLWTAAEWIFCAQFALVAVWLAMRKTQPLLPWHF